MSTRERIVKPLRRFAGEILISFSAVAGWALLTASVANVLPDAGARSVWFASTGLFLLSLCGWKFLRKIVTDGLYALTRPKRG